jgi:hypothetical protein
VVQKYYNIIFALVGFFSGQSMADPFNGLAVVGEIGKAGILCLTDLADSQRVRDFPVSTDTVVRSFGDYIWALNRDPKGTRGRLQIIPLREGLSSKTFDLRRLAKSAAEEVIFSNPQDVFAAHDEHAVVISFLESSDLIVVNPWQPRERLQRIDLSAYADEDGVPEATRMHHIPEKHLLAIQLQRLNRNNSWLPSEDGARIIFVKLDGSFEVQHEMTVKLHGKNPLGDILRGPGGRLYLPFTGSGSGLELLAADSLQSLGVVPIAGQLRDVVFHKDRGFAILVHSYSEPVEYETVVVEIDPKDGKLIREVAVSKRMKFHAFQKLAVHQDRLLVAEVSEKSGIIRNFDLNSFAEGKKVVIDDRVRPSDMMLFTHYGIR